MRCDSGFSHWTLRRPGSSLTLVGGRVSPSLYPIEKDNFNFKCQCHSASRWSYKYLLLPTLLKNVSPGHMILLVHGSKMTPPWQFPMVLCNAKHRELILKTQRVQRFLSQSDPRFLVPRASDLRNNCIQFEKNCTHILAYKHMEAWYTRLLLFIIIIIFLLFKALFL